MDDILFRGQLKETNEWVYWDVFGNLVDINGKRKRYSITNGAKTKYFYTICQINQHIITDTVGRFIGISDKNNNKIFEADIVQTLETYNGGLRCFPVVKHQAAFWLYDEWLDCKYDFICGYKKEALTVLGNIYDNPELLKEGESAERDW